jgi:DNA-binding transcriptional ArsR family regulator
VNIDSVFKALADPTRRKLLDALRSCDGQSLSQLCAGLGLTRQGVTQHLDRLEQANLISVVWKGREKLHYLNPVPIQEIYDRWIRNYQRQHLEALQSLKNRAEGAHYIISL